MPIRPCGFDYCDLKYAKSYIMPLSSGYYPYRRVGTSWTDIIWIPYHRPYFEKVPIKYVVLVLNTGGRWITIQVRMNGYTTVGSMTTYAYGHSTRLIPVNIPSGYYATMQVRAKMNSGSGYIYSVELIVDENYW